MSGPVRQLAAHGFVKWRGPLKKVRPSHYFVRPSRLAGFEPATYGLGNRCSIPELQGEFIISMLRLFVFLHFSR